MPVHLQFVRSGFSLVVDSTILTNDNSNSWQATVIAVLEQWFSQTVVPWVQNEHDIYVEVPAHSSGLWIWAFGKMMGELRPTDRGSDPSPTEAYLQCAEALAGVIGGQG